MLTILLLVVILANFYLLTKGVLKTEVGMTLTAIAAIILAGPVEGHDALEHGFAEFSTVAVLFTAIAVPAHILERSGALTKIGLRIGEFVGKVTLTQHINVSATIITISLFMTYIFAGALHNTTSILVTSVIITLICKSYRVPVVPTLSGALIASNLGGFSTRWGDTPNIVEARIWGLDHADFFGQIMPLNIGALLLLIGFVYFMVARVAKRENIKPIDSTWLAYAMVEFRSVRLNSAVDRRLLFIGVFGIAAAVLGSLLFPEYEITIAAAVIALCTLGDYKEHRSKALFALGLETYATLLSIFVLSQVMANSSIGIGEQLYQLLAANDAGVPTIVITSYLGTLLTEAASWATAASPIVYELDNSTRAAWALGAGICAGSSSLITAATAGIILLNESSRNEPENQVTFSRYLITGLSFSAIMVVYYIVTLTIFFP